MTQAVAIRAELFPQGREPTDLTEAREWVIELARTCRRSAIQGAVLIAFVKDTYFPEHTGDWLAWCESDCGYAPGSAHQLYRVGAFVTLIVSKHPSLLQCGIQALDALHRLYEAKPEQFEGLLRVWDPAEHTGAQVKRKVAGFLTDPGTRRCEQCGEPFNATDGKDKLCEKCREAKRRRKAARKARSIDRTMGDIAGLDEAQKDLLANEIPPTLAMRAGLTLIELALMSQERFHGWSEEDFTRLDSELGSHIESFRYLAANR